jgi:hypothetical protein
MIAVRILVLCLSLFSPFLDGGTGFFLRVSVLFGPFRTEFVAFRTELVESLVLTGVDFLTAPATAFLLLQLLPS